MGTNFLNSCCVGAPTPPSGSVICQEDFQDSAHSPAHGCDLFRWKGARPAAEGRGARARTEEARSTRPASSPESHRMALVPPCVKCPPGKLIFLGAGHVRSCTYQNCRPRKTGRFLAQARRLHSEPLLSVRCWEPSPSSQTPAQGPACKPAFLRSAVSGLLC